MTGAAIRRRLELVQAERQGFLTTGRWEARTSQESARCWRSRCREVGEASVVVYRRGCRVSAVEFELEPAGIDSLPADLAQDVEDAFSYFVDRGFCTTASNGSYAFANCVPSGYPADNLARKLLGLARQGQRRRRGGRLVRRDIEREVEEWARTSAGAWFNSYSYQAGMLTDLVTRLELLVCREAAGGARDPEPSSPH